MLLLAQLHNTQWRILLPWPTSTSRAFPRTEGGSVRRVAAKAAGFRGKMPALCKVFYETRGGARKAPARVAAKAVKPAKALTGGLAEIETVVQREVEAAFEAAGLKVLPAPHGFKSTPPGWGEWADWVPSASGMETVWLASRELIGLLWYRLRGLG